jgi:hypothetical protein
MDLIYFPDGGKEQKFILERYADEIRLRAKWIIDTAEEVNNSLEKEESASVVIRKTMDLVGHAIVILRIVDPKAIGARPNESERTKERVRLIRKKWPEIPDEFPQGLRAVRNDYEHFDARLDQWAMSSERRQYSDLNVGPKTDGLDVYEDLRRFNGDTLYFWNRAVNLSEVVQWSQQVAEAVSK